MARHEISASNIPNNDDDGLWALPVLQNKMALLLKHSLNLTLLKVPGDGHCLIHAITRSLGLFTPAQWSGNRNIAWARLFRYHLARHVLGEHERAFLHGNEYLEDRHAILFARLWRLRIQIQGVQEVFQHQISVGDAVYFPLNQDSDLLDVNLVCYWDKSHFDAIVPTAANFHAHRCIIMADDMDNLFALTEEGMARFDRFIFQWLDVLRSPNPQSVDQKYKFSSVSAFLQVFREDSWPALPYVADLLQHDGSVFTNDENALSDFNMVNQGGVGDGASPDSTVESAPTNEVHSNDRYKIVCVYVLSLTVYLFVACIFVRWYEMRYVSQYLVDEVLGKYAQFDCLDSLLT